MVRWKGEFEPEPKDFPFEGEPHEEESYKDPRVGQAKSRIAEVIKEVKVVTDREIKVRLEKEFFPWVVGRAVIELEDNGTLTRHGYVGRRRIGRGVPESFFSLADTRYEEIMDTIQEKRRISADINTILTGEAPASIHAEDLFLEALLSLDFTCHGRDVSEFRGRKVSGVAGKEPPNLDFIIEKDNILYGVDVKNWIRYESDSRDDIESKVRLALQLGVTPFIIARYVDQDTIYTEIIPRGLCYRFGTLLIPSSFESLAKQAQELLGYPVLALDSLPDYKTNWLLKLHKERLGKVQ